MKPQLKEPKPPFPPQKLEKPGIESELRPQPRFRAPEYKPAGKLDGKVALITGGDSGIGRSVAVLYAREGSDVAITALPAEHTDAEETRRAVEAAGRRCVVLEGDLADEQFCRTVIDRTMREFGRLDVLVHNAAHQNHWKRLEDVPDEEWDRTFKVNIYAYFWLVRTALPHLKPGATIIASGSQTGIAGSGRAPAYATTKGAISHVHQDTVADAPRARHPGELRRARASLDAAECGRPGRTPEEIARFGERAPIGRPAQPEEVAPAYVFLASDGDSRYVSGEILNVLGGTTTAG